MPALHLASITGHRTVDEINDDDIFVDGKIDDNCKVTLVSRNGNIVVQNKIDNHCNVTLIAAGSVRIGTEGDSGDKKIDNNCNVSVEAGGEIHLGYFINNHCNVSFDAGGDVSMGGKIDDNSTVTIESGGSVSVGDKVDNNCSVDIRAVGDIDIGGKIDNNCTVTMDTLRGGVRIQGKIDDHTTVYLSAANDIRIGLEGGSSDRHINNACQVFATCGGQIWLGDKIGDNCFVEFRACDAITVVSVVERGCRVFFETSPGREIRVRKIRDDNTEVTYWGGQLIEEEPRHQNPTVRSRQWSDAPLFCGGRPEVTGEWWQNWGWKYGYVAREKLLPTTLEELVAFVASLDASKRTKAVGGAWSFTDASLPFDTKEGVDFVSIEKRGIGGKQPVKKLLEGAPGSFQNFLFDHQPNTVVRDRKVSTKWSQSRLTNEVRSGYHLPAAPPNASIIDTRRLASSLQAAFASIASGHAKKQLAGGRHFFHVEAGITIADLNVLLDHQKPRLAIQASGGSPGATLAGTLSTATHGGEFDWPLLVDRVKAIHFVGPGGTEWWIEGDESIADFSKLAAVYPGITHDHFIAGDWRSAACLEGITALDVLKAVTVSMGTMGIIYSVVLEVVPAFGLRQKVKRIGRWVDLLQAAGVSEGDLRDRSEAANGRLLEFILDGRRNGTGILRRSNVYVDLALNPINRMCWIINRQVTDGIPREHRDLDLSVGRYEKSFRRELTNQEAGIFGAIDDEMLARVMDFLNYGRSLSDVVNDFGQAGRLMSFLMSRPPLLATVLSTVNGQLTINELFRTETSRKRDFVGDILSGLLNALMGTVVGDVSDITDLSYRVGAIGWSDEGLPGKGFEIALPPTIAFSFLQSAILDPLGEASSAPLIGYISIRVCPQTKTLMGMQQFGDHSVMIEPVGFRTPQSLALFQGILDRLFQWNDELDVGGMLHWGLENDALGRNQLERTAVNLPLRPGALVTKLTAFKAIKAFLQGSHPPVFDNHFVKRLGLDDHRCEPREVRATRKKHGQVVALCNDGQPWSPVTEAQAIMDIQGLRACYYVNSGGERVFLYIVHGPTGSYLRTTPDGTVGDNLLDLPDC